MENQIETTPAVSDPTGPFCTHPRCRGKDIPAPFAFIRGDWEDVRPACSKHATADKDGKPWLLVWAQAAAAQYRRVQAEFQDRTTARPNRTAKPVLTKVAPPAPPDPDLILLKQILEVVGRANTMEIRTQQAGLAIMNGRGQYCSGRQRGLILIRGRDGEKTVFPVDGDHWRGAHRLKALAKAASGRLGLFTFESEAEMAEFEKRKRRQQPREPRPGPVDASVPGIEAQLVAINARFKPQPQKAEAKPNRKARRAGREAATN
ncbi:hypothetical protein A3D72_00260 [Candidatus Uhrbacteria bacterium RIFCSPHIGHO2_02_FULL_57_19]|uniref:Uncharacterized protein n=1 Tax=Candidatus Uhrbacteria bacterium RIFCSPHIGHO2_02_FULL_57_19 TaxID=1802391 RepID=A0A1F7U5P0_9BACT|nr:MAG: hypothetical protein A3D72_00260 [Candidatus Uhrbacteria bacterium RIFCSPHIGHO2_02_FULL_57_19]